MESGDRVRLAGWGTVIYFDDDSGYVDVAFDDGYERRVWWGWLKVS